MSVTEVDSESRISRRLSCPRSDVLAELCDGFTLETLHFISSLVAENAWEAIAFKSNLKRLAVNQGISPTQLDALLTRNKQLDTLRLIGLEFDLSKLQHLTRISSLEITVSQIPNDIQRLRQVRYLQLLGPLSAKVGETLHKLPHLEFLYAEEVSPLTSEFWVAVSQLPKLRHLSVDAPGPSSFDDAALNLICRMKSLERLEIHVKPKHLRVSQGALERAGRMKDLQVSLEQ